MSVSLCTYTYTGIQNLVSPIVSSKLRKKTQKFHWKLLWALLNRPSSGSQFVSCNTLCMLGHVSRYRLPYLYQHVAWWSCRTVTFDMYKCQLGGRADQLRGGCIMRSLELRAWRERGHPWGSTFITRVLMRCLHSLPCLTTECQQAADRQ